MEHIGNLWPSYRAARKISDERENWSTNTSANGWINVCKCMCICANTQCITICVCVLFCVYACMHTVYRIGLHFARHMCVTPLLEVRLVAVADAEELRTHAIVHVMCQARKLNLDNNSCACIRTHIHGVQFAYRQLT
jgi:hypothetical protein